MSNREPTPTVRSLRAALLVPFLGTSLLLWTTMVLVTQVASRHYLEDHLVRRAEQRARMLMYAAQTLPSAEQLQRLVTAGGSDRDILTSLVAEGEPLRVVASTRDVWLNSPLAEVPAPDLIAASEAGPVSSHLADRIRVVLPFSLPDTGGGPRPGVVIVEVADAVEHSRLLRELGVTTALMALLAGVLVMTGLWVINRRVIRPLAAIRAALLARRRGAVDTRISLQPTDEIGEIAVALDESFDELQALNERREAQATEMKHLLEARRITEQRLSFLLSSTAAIVYAARMDADRTPTFVSSNVETLTGIPARRFIENPGLWARRVHPEDAERLKDAMSRVSDTGTCVLEYRWQLESGEYRWIRDDQRLVRDDTGRPIETIGFIIDVTEHKDIETRLRLSEERLREAQAIARVGSWHLDPTTDEFEGSDELCRLFGVPPGQRVGRAGLRAMIFPEDRAAARSLLRGTTTEQQFRVRLAHGMRWLRVRARVEVGADGAVVSAVGTCQDVTDIRSAEQKLRESELRFRQIAETIDEVFWISDERTARLLYISPAFERIWGRARDTLNGGPSRFFDTIHEDDREHLRATLRNLAGEGRDFFVHEYRIRRPDGSIRWISGRGFRMQDEATGQALLIGAAMDVTEKKVADDQLRQAQKMEAIGQLTGGLAHDFNNLLGIVVGNLDLISERLPANDKLQRNVSIALDAALRGADVTRALLAVARRQPMAVGDHDLNALLHETMPLLQASVGSSITVKMDLASGPLPARLDPAGLSNVVLNLVINARDALQGTSGPREINIRTSSRAIDAASPLNLAPGRYAVMEVCDTGPGMTPEVLAQAFEPCFTTKERSMGTGLGLSMVHGFAEQLGGTATIRSSVGAGATVSVFLAQGEGKKEAPTERPPAEIHLAPQPSRASCRVLIVDDEEEMCALARGWLDALGYQTACAHSAEAALAALEREPFEILFTDIVMPGGMDGIELARRALRQHPKLRLLLTTGYTNRSEDAASLPGALLTKPYRKPDLTRALASLLAT